MKYLLIAMFLVILGQSMTYFLSQAQFIWPWAKQNPILLSLFGAPISLVFIYFTKYCAIAFDGQVWPGRIIQFAIGAISFAILSKLIMGETLTIKTSLCLVLSAVILFIQVFWK